MRFSLQRKLLALLALVILIALSSSLVLRNLVIRDFRAFGEGRMLDRLYQIQAVLEGRYEQRGSWQRELVANDLVWAWLQGFDLRLYDADNRPVLDTEQALSSLSPTMQQRILASTGRRPLPPLSDAFQSYPLFLQGNEIGHLEVRLPSPVHEAFFIRSSNRFLAYSVVGLGLFALLLSALAARRISRPLQELTRAAERLAAGEPGGQVTAASTDEIGRLAVTFNRMSETLVAQERLRRQLVSNAAHELRTPLMVIKGELEGMMDGLLPVTPEALQSLHDETTRLTAILDGVDELTRAQAAGLRLNLQPICLIPFFRQVIARFERQAAEQQVRIRIEGNEKQTALIDPDQFTRIIINLVGNALRAMPNGGQFDVLVTSTIEHLISCSHHHPPPNLPPLGGGVTTNPSPTPGGRRVTTSLSPAPGGGGTGRGFKLLQATRPAAPTIAIHIMDTGHGIPSDQLPHIFERFYKGKDGGLGLGLAIVKELVEAHAGSIVVTSTPGKGTSFLIQLPQPETQAVVT